MMVNRPLKIRVSKYYSGLVTWEKPWVVHCPVCVNPEWSIFNLVREGTFAFYKTWGEALQAANYHVIAHYQGNVNTYGHLLNGRRQ